MSTRLADIIKQKDKLRIGIIGAMDQEVELLKSALQQVEEHQYAGYSFYTGLMHGQSVVLLKSGIGKVNAAV